MKSVIKEYNEKLNTFKVIIEDKEKYFYLTKKDAKKYEEMLFSGAFVDFEVSTQEKKIDKISYTRVTHFNKIGFFTERGLKITFDNNLIKEEIIKVMWRFKHYLFIDIEMSMPSYYHTGTHQAEIVQVGYLLTDKNLNVIKKADYYLKPSNGRFVSKRTLKFLNVKREVFNDAKEYDYFYEDLKGMLKTYKPKIVVWGKNDILVLKDSYKINKKDALTTSRSFIDLLKIHKNYFNLKDDLGLFKAYETYYNKSLPQSHDAYEDAKIMLEVFKYFRKLKSQ